MITLFTIPKPFEGHIGTIQRNALGSWVRLHPQAQVLIFGDEPGTAAAAAAVGATQIPEIARNEYGTPVLSDAFARARGRARNDLLCFANADIVLFADLVDAAVRVRERSRAFLLIGECWNASVREEIVFAPGWEARLRHLPARKRGADALDFFLFTSELYKSVPPFAVGRTVLDNWLIWRARSEDALVVDVTPVVRPLHQNHDYAHGGTLASIRISPEAERNRALAGGKSHLYSRFDATHRLTRSGLRTNLLARRRVGERSRRSIAKLRFRVLGVPDR